MRKQFILCAAALILCTSAAGTLTACGDRDAAAAPLDPAECGTITGSVHKRKNGELVSGARITAEEVTTAAKYETSTDQKGYFELMVPEGTYTITITKSDFYGLSTDEYSVTKGNVCAVTEKLELIGTNESLSDEPAVESSPDPAPVFDYHAAYEAYIEELKARREYRGLDGNPVTNFANLLDYVYFDMDRDGTDELIVNTGSCEADRSICFYTFKNNTVMLIGSSFSGLHVYGYYRDEETRMIVTQWAHMGSGGATWYQYNGELLSVVNEVGPITYEGSDPPQFAENLTPLDYHVGVLLDDGWHFT